MHSSGCAAPLPFDAPRSVRRKRDAATLPTSMTSGAAGTGRSLQKKRRGGTAQQCHSHKKYKEAVAVAVEKRADDTKWSDVLHLMEVAG